MSYIFLLYQVLNLMLEVVRRMMEITRILEVTMTMTMTMTRLMEMS